MEALRRPNLRSPIELRCYCRDAPTNTTVDVTCNGKHHHVDVVLWFDLACRRFMGQYIALDGVLSQLPIISVNRHLPWVARSGFEHPVEKRLVTDEEFIGLMTKHMEHVEQTSLAGRAFTDMLQNAIVGILRVVYGGLMIYTCAYSKHVPGQQIDVDKLAISMAKSIAETDETPEGKVMHTEVMSEDFTNAVISFYWGTPEAYTARVSLLPRIDLSTLDLSPSALFALYCKVIAEEPVQVKLGSNFYVEPKDNGLDYFLGTKSPTVLFAMFFMMRPWYFMQDPQVEDGTQGASLSTENDFEQDKCPVCLSELQGLHMVLRLHPCRHLLCNVCWQHTLQVALKRRDSRASCPICRTDVVSYMQSAIAHDFDR
uniref:RING-type domain-containing protein n=1 Tax=Eutreptiella gymnastica TaxID=73025 RepID=A0A7S1J0J6_9EUGL|mmetsp:Transcript_58014/g.103605  ORF Transcript_58014/g.103605 Transcript_58014/m.103605 type:complete len:371 (+) Transcript_58014:82-1194(+)